MNQAFVVSGATIAGTRVVRSLGLVRGNSIRARHVGKDIMASLRNIVGGEIHEYAKLLAESREQALDRMVAQAEELGANAVLSVRVHYVGRHGRRGRDAGLRHGGSRGARRGVERCASVRVRRGPTRTACRTQLQLARRVCRRFSRLGLGEILKARMNFNE